MENNGTLTDMNAKVQGDYLVFETNHFSLYVVVNHNISENILYGDANNDGIVNSADAVLIKKHLAGYKDLGINEEASDVNLDGAVTSADAVLVLKKLAGYDVVLGN